MLLKPEQELGHREVSGMNVELITLPYEEMASLWNNDKFGFDAFFLHPGV